MRLIQVSFRRRASPTPELQCLNNQATAAECDAGTNPATGGTADQRRLRRLSPGYDRGVLPSVNDDGVPRSVKAQPKRSIVADSSAAVRHLGIIGEDRPFPRQSESPADRGPPARCPRASGLTVAPAPGRHSWSAAIDFQRAGLRAGAAAWNDSSRAVSVNRRQSANSSVVARRSHQTNRGVTLRLGAPIRSELHKSCDQLAQ